MTPERLAELFHETYERLAPEYGWTGDRSTACAWSSLPENNQGLMVATAAELIAAGEVTANTRVPNDLDGTHCPCVGEHNPDPAEDEMHHLVPLGAPFHGADVAANRRRLCGTAHGNLHVLLRVHLAARKQGVPVPRDRLVHFSRFTRRLAGVALHALDSGVDRPTTPDLDWVEVTFRT